MIVVQKKIQKIEGALDQIRPYLKSDGGDIRLIEVSEDNIVKVELLGACGSCEVSLMTLKVGVEQAIRKVFPALKELVEINS